MSKVVENRIEELEKLIPYYAEKYYSGKEEIDDKSFDELVEELRELDPGSRILNTTGWGSEEYGQKYDHKYQLVGSLAKTREWEGIPSQFKEAEIILLSQKLDGSSAVVQYENGKLVRALTRGNGRQGLDITSKLRKILKYDFVHDNFTGEVRGELIMSQSNWEIMKEIEPGLKNSRNAVAGIINRKDVNDELLKLVDYVVYKVTGSENKEFKNLQEERDWLKLNFEHFVMSFPINRTTMNNKDEWDFQSKEFYTKIFPTSGYQADGIVLSLNEIQKQENGALVHSEFAYKFETEMKWSRVIGIEWNLSRNQRVVPTIIFEPIILGETTVQRATGFNAQFVKNNEIKKGSMVKISLRNEIIPNIEEIKNE